MRVGISLGLTLIDTAEAYGGGLAEQMIGRVITGQRDHVFIVSKVLPSHADPAGIRRACEGSLGRLGTDHLDLYLLHWRDGIRDLSPVVSTFEELKAAGRIRRWGVSNFRVGDMEDLLRVPAGDRYAINQVEYSLANRHIERDLLPWCQHKLPIRAHREPFRTVADHHLINNTRRARFEIDHPHRVDLAILPPADVVDDPEFAVRGHLDVEAG